MKEYNRVEAELTARDVLSVPRDFAFAMVTDTHLDDNTADIAESISCVDEEVRFDCLMHMGDMINGGLSKAWSLRLMGEHIDLFRSAVEGGFYPAQGNHDGYCDETGNDLGTDGFFREATGYLLEDARVTMPGKRPYYYVDFDKQKIRLIVLATFDCVRTDAGWEHVTGMDKEQAEWLEREALDLEAEWTVMLFSHDVPFEEYTDDALTAGGKEYSRRALKALIDQRDKRGFDVAGWFVGHMHGDWAGKVCGVNFVLVGCATAYVPQLWGMPEGGVFEPRKMNDVTENLWDAAILDKRNRRVRLFRFGAGQDRTIEY